MIYMAIFYGKKAAVGDVALSGFIPMKSKGLEVFSFP